MNTGYSRLASLLLAGCALSSLMAASPALAGDEAPKQIAADPNASAVDSAAPQIVISGTRLPPEAKAVQEERKSDNIKSVLTADQIQKLPDVNLGEALQRIPGVELEADSGQGRFVNIRGLDADLNGTYFDGVHLTANNAASPLGGARGVAMDVFPSDLVSGVEVEKSLIPEMDAEGVGGQVNVLSHTMPVGGASFAQAHLGSGYEPLRGTPVYVGGLTFGISFGPNAAPTMFGEPATDRLDRPFRLILNYDYDEDQRGIDDVEEAYGSNLANGDLPLNQLEARWYRYHRVRQGMSGEFDWDPNASTGFYVRAIRSGYTEQAAKHELIMNGIDGSNTGGALTDNGGGSYVSTQSTALQRYIDSAERIETNLVTAGGHFDVAGRIMVDFQGGWTKGSDNFLHSDTVDFGGLSSYTLNYTINDPEHRTFSSGTPGFNLSDPTQYALSKFRNQPSYHWDEEYSARLNVAVPFDFYGADSEIKVGGSIRLRDVGTDQSEYDATINNAAPLSNFIVGGNQIYYNNWYNIGPDINRQAAIGTVSGLTTNTDTANQGFARATENVYSGYAQYKASFGKFDVIGGIRVEATDATQLANIYNSDVGSYALHQNSESYTNAFPSIQGKYQVLPDLQLRASYSTGIARPGFNQITGAVTVSDANATVNIGNPNLKPMTADSFDFGASYDLPGGGVAGAGIFYKSFQNYIITTAYFAPYNGSATNYFFTSYQNTPNSHAEGLELSFYKPFTFLPAPFDGFAFRGNYTFVQSDAVLRPGDKTERMPSTSPENVNFGLSYDKGPYGFELGGNYLSSNLFGVGSNRAQDIFSAARFRLDVGATYKLNDNVTLYFDAKNLTDTPLEFTQGTSSANPIQREFYDATYYGGVRVQF